MRLIMYWNMYRGLCTGFCIEIIWGFGIGSLAAFAFFSFPFTSFHFLAFPIYFLLKKLGYERS